MLATNLLSLRQQAQFRPLFVVLLLRWAGVSSSTKRVAADGASPLDDSGVLLHVFNILGPGHHLFISAVSKAWRESYKKVASVQVVECAFSWEYYEKTTLHTITSKMTCCSAVFASASRVRLAHELGLRLAT
jgi:hypothetical protein